MIDYNKKAYSFICKTKRICYKIMKSLNIEFCSVLTIAMGEIIKHRPTIKLLWFILLNI